MNYIYIYIYILFKIGPEVDMTITKLYRRNTR